MDKGDYVLATKYNDGDPKDHFCIGLYDGKLFTRDGVETDRHMIVDSDGKLFRANGFRRCQKVSDANRALFANNVQLLEKCSASIWYWYYHPKQFQELVQDMQR